MWLLSLLAAALPSLSSSLLVELPLGKVWGEAKQGVDPAGDAVNWTSFTGIPFAQPPVDELRFLPPQPANSTQQRAAVMCPQVGSSFPPPPTTGSIVNHDLHQGGWRRPARGQ